MKTSEILITSVRYLIPLLLIFSFFLLLRGHNDPGGGFIGGLVAASAYTLYAIAKGVKDAQRLLRIEPLKLISLGLIISLFSGLPSVFMGMDFMTGIWLKTEFPVIGKIGTPLIFDIGVYLLVLGISTKIMYVLAEEEE